MELLHHINVVETGRTGLAPTDIFKAAGHVFLPVQVIGGIAAAPQGRFRRLQHGGHGFGGQQARPVQVQVGAALDGQGVDRHIGRVQGQTPGKGIGKARGTVAGQTGDEVHIDGREARRHGVLVGSYHIRRCVAASHTL